MNDIFDKQLIKKYPKIFANRYKDMKETCMCWGFEHGDGWYNIIDNLCSKIQKYIDESNGKVLQVVAIQVKEKFGTLRFYIDGGDDEVYKMIDEAERLSGITCEFCGATENVGSTQHPAWIFTLCEECAKKRDKIKNWKKNGI